MTTKFRVETVMTTSIHLRIRSVEDRGISQTHDIIPQTKEKSNTFSKKSFKKKTTARISEKTLTVSLFSCIMKKKSKGETPCLPC